MPLTVQASQGDSREGFKPARGPVSKWGDKVMAGSYHHYCSEQNWSPAINIYESPEQYTIVVDLAGVQGEEIELEAQEGMLQLTGLRQAPNLTEDVDRVKIQLMEIDHGQFCRAVELPEDADDQNITASYRGGLLWILIPRT